MAITSELATQLRLLDQVLEGSPSDIAATLVRLMSEAALAVSTLLGLSILVRSQDEAPLELTTFGEDRIPEKVGTSLRFTLGGDAAAGDGPLGMIELVLYAAQPGAFVDLAADLCWLTGRPAEAFRIDEDPMAPQGAGTSLVSWSTVNQARGVLMSGGLTLEESDLELDARATAAGIGRHRAASELLADLPPHPFRAR